MNTLNLDKFPDSLKKSFVECGVLEKGRRPKYSVGEIITDNHGNVYKYLSPGNWKYLGKGTREQFINKEKEAKTNESQPAEHKTEKESEHKTDIEQKEEKPKFSGMFDRELLQGIYKNLETLKHKYSEGFKITNEQYLKMAIIKTAKDKGIEVSDISERVKQRLRGDYQDAENNEGTKWLKEYISKSMELGLFDFPSTIRKSFIETIEKAMCVACNQHVVLEDVEGHSKRCGTMRKSNITNNQEIEFQSEFNRLANDLYYCQMILEHCHRETKSEPRHSALGEAYETFAEKKDAILECTMGNTGYTYGDIESRSVPTFGAELPVECADFVCDLALEIENFASMYEISSVEGIAQELHAVGAKLQYKLSLGNANE